MSLGKLTIDADDVGVVSIKVTKIFTVRAASHFYRLESIHREVFFTRIEPDTTAGHIRITTGDSTISMPLDEIATLSSFKGPKSAQWEGTVSAGYSFTRSSTIGRLNGDGTIKCITRKWETVAQYSVIITQTDTGWTRDNESGGLTGYYFIDPQWQAVGYLNYQRNLELGLARRFQEGAGMAYSLLSSSHIRVRTGTGIVFNQKLNIEGVQSPTQVEIPFVNSFNFFSFSKPDMSLTSTQNLFFSLTQKGRIRHDGQIKLTWKPITDFSINLTLYDNYDSQPPGEDAATIDYGIVFSLGYTFSQ